MEFIEAPAFTRHISDYLDADEYRLLQNALLKNPDLGGHWRISEGPLGGCETWKREERWFEDHLLSLLVRSPDLVNDDIQQRRGCGPHRGGEKGDKVCAGHRTEGTGEKANCASGDPKEEATVMAKRNILIELMEGVASMKSHREGKLTLRSYKVEPAPLPKVDSKLIKDTRERLHCSRAVFARKLHVNERTLEKWEQGRAKPNPQAAALVLLVRKYPDTLKRLENVAAG